MEKTMSKDPMLEVQKAVFAIKETMETYVPGILKKELDDKQKLIIAAWLVNIREMHENISKISDMDKGVLLDSIRDDVKKAKNAHNSPSDMEMSLEIIDVNKSSIMGLSNIVLREK
jgi:hypothetical protein